MNEFSELAHKAGPQVAAVVVGFLSGFIPVVNAEIFVVAVAAMVSTKTAAAMLGVNCAVGQMIAKMLIFFGAAGALKLPFLKKIPRERIDRMSERILAMRGGAPAVTFVSAFVGFPPFLIFSVVAGLLKFNPYMFGVLGLVGRALRFGLIALFPQWIKHA